nr:hypothetical protein [Planctomycetales bacterium]
MSTPAHVIFRKICLHNKLADEKTLDRLLLEYANPEDLVHLWIEQQKLSEKVGRQLLEIYHKKLDQHFATLTGMTIVGKMPSPTAAAEAAPPSAPTAVAKQPPQAPAAKQPTPAPAPAVGQPPSAPKP